MGATPRRVTLADGLATIDGGEQRAAQPQTWSPATRRQQAKGGRR
jgi:hypothetical protein